MAFDIDDPELEARILEIATRERKTVDQVVLEALKAREDARFAVTNGSPQRADVRRPDGDASGDLG